MGSKSDSRSSQDTENNSTSFGIQGDNNGLVLNGNGNTVTDGGAFKLVGNLVDILPIFFTQGVNAISDLASSGERQTENAFNTAFDMYQTGVDANSDMMRLGANMMTETGEVLSGGLESAFDFGTEAMRTVSDNTETALKENALLADTSIKGNLALSNLVSSSLSKANDNNTYLAGLSMENSSDLAESLTKAAIDSTGEVNRQNTNQLVDGYEMMLGYADQLSRSDDNQLALDTNNTMLMMVGGFILLTLGVVFVASRK